ncbi:hypothetical protein KXD93_02980 [Mucilaginibacter sp. BJC16-A38]|uniref:hypothetical protein n=1 Tax=Mucilaginibacter phenanthrenivorans TaxID=1234842 RepID=UPI002157DC30|nr:hypothetical protein [Mucilaginibacter phenanthrenivorans]MCR8556585.1 hypothetical protein [Mucilaginibacter phenanthrenivorans]
MNYTDNNRQQQDWTQGLKKFSIFGDKAFHFYTWNTRNAVKHADYQRFQKKTALQF